MVEFFIALRGAIDELVTSSTVFLDEGLLLVTFFTGKVHDEDEHDLALLLSQYCDEACRCDASAY